MPLAKEDLARFKVLQFDCYGPKIDMGAVTKLDAHYRSFEHITLIDWETGMKDALKPLSDQPGAPDPDTILATVGKHAAYVEGDQPQMMYPEVLQYAYGKAADELGLKWTQHDAELFGYSCPRWPEFPDSADALKTLHELGFKLTVLSNVDNSSFEGTRRLLERGFNFDAVYTAADIGSYKPAAQNFTYAMSKDFDQWGTEPREILIVANSKLHDLEPGRKLGFKGAWIDRKDAHIGVSGQEDFVPDWTFSSMADFADTVKSVLGGKPIEASREDKANAILTNDEEACKPHFPLDTAC